VITEKEPASQDILVSILRSQRAIFGAIRESSLREKLTLQQFGILRLLSHYKSLPMNALSDELKVTRPDITGIVDRLEKKALVKRIERSTDRRTTDLVITEKGKKLYGKIRECYSSLLQESLERSLTPQEQETLARLLRRLAREIPV
jgi:MarR family transcriptional regulator, 2-MHQ and catechol-resistance regulon repressor